MPTPERCPRCDMPIVIDPHWEMTDCIAALKAGNNIMQSFYVAAMARAETAEADNEQLQARVAELEAELAIESRTHRQLPGVEVQSGAA